MPPAARMGDPTSHGLPLSPGPGSANVLIGGKPAWRAGSDLHMCLPAPPPHGAGVVSMGSATVLINGLPAVRMGDSVMEPGGGPNAIIMGEPTVIIG